MQKKSPNKLAILMKCISLVNNWYVIPLVYYGLKKDPFVILTLKNGLNIKLRTNSTDLQAFVNVWVLQEYQKDGFEINNDDIVIDVGGHIGLFTLYLSQFIKNGKIFSFEPIKENYELLQENVRLNNLKNVSLFNFAISKKRGDIRIYLNDKDQAAHSLYTKSDTFVEAESVTLEDVLISNDITSCDLLKLDCEGAEYEIVESLNDEQFFKIKKICLEYHLTTSDPSLLIKLKDNLRMHYQLSDFPSADGMGILFANNLQRI